MKALNIRLLDAVSPKKLFMIFAFAEMITWAGLITALILRFAGITDQWVTPAGGIHGFIFLCYCVTTVFVWVNQRWKTGAGILALITAIIPFATVPLEIIFKRRGMLEGVWRLRPGADIPQGFVETVQAWVLRNLLMAIVLGILLIVALFIVLLILGPPIPKA